MDAERWRQLGPLLDRALDLGGDAREAWLAELDGSDPDVASDLRELLQEQRAAAAEGFLDRGPEPPAALAGLEVGAYRLISPIGRGGMGSVWLAERCDGRFEGRAAVKLLNVALAGAGERRFQREGGILARLTHPHIARLLDAGMSVAGQPFLVLEYVQGEAIDTYCDGRRIGVVGRLRLFLDVLSAVAHAHANLIVHRDIKPSNVFVTREGSVKLLDFGIAKLLTDESGESTALTLEGGAPMTPEYAAPEQLTGEPVSTATDVYALGVLLYVLLSGRHPAGSGRRTPADLVRASVEGRPVRPSDRVLGTAGEDPETRPAAEKRGTTPDRLRRALRGDLDTIIGKALKPRPAERYAAIADFADDIRRHLAHEPIRARPDTLVYRTSRFVRRNRAPVVLSLVALAATAAGVFGTVLQARAAKEQRDFALRQLARAEAINDLNNFLLSDAAPSGKPLAVRELLAQAEQIVSQQDPDDPGRVDLLIAVGRQYQHQDDQAGASRLLDEAYERSRGLVDPSVRARAACALGSARAQSTELAQAEELVLAGLAELDDRPQFTLDRIFCLRCGGEVARDAGRAQLAIERIREAQGLLRQVPARFELAELRLLIDLADSYRVAGEYVEAAAVSEQAAARLTALGRDHTETAGTLFNNWGLALSLFGRPLQAEALFRRAIDIGSRDAGEASVSPMLLINHARVLRELTLLDEAADYAERGYGKARESSNEMVVVQSLLLRTWIYLDRREPERAAAALSEVEPMVRDGFPADHVVFAVLASLRSGLAVLGGDPQRGRGLADEAVSLCERWVVAGNGADYLPTLLVRRSDVERTVGRLEAAEADARRAVELLSAATPQGQHRSSLGRAYLALGQALGGLGREEDARAALRSATEQLRGSLGPAHPATRLAGAGAG